MPKPRKLKCLHCRDLFRPDHRNVAKQKYCTKQDCRKASKAANQKKWLSKEENADYFKGPENIKRVQQWRERNLGYWKKQKALQDDIVMTWRRLQQLGQDILFSPHPNSGGQHDHQKHPPCSTPGSPGT